MGNCQRGSIAPRWMGPLVVLDNFQAERNPVGLVPSALRVAEHFLCDVSMLASGCYFYIQEAHDGCRLRPAKGTSASMMRGLETGIMS